MIDIERLFEAPLYTQNEAKRTMGCDKRVDAIRKTSFEPAPARSLTPASSIGAQGSVDSVEIVDEQTSLDRRVIIDMIAVLARSEHIKELQVSGVTVRGEGEQPSLCRSGEAPLKRKDRSL